MLRIARGAWWFAVAGMAASVSAAGAQTIRYVDDSAPPGGDGSSWASPLNSLQAALAGLTAGDEVRVAQGTYVPGAPGSRTATFLVPAGVALRGGYAGFGAADPDERDPVLYVTILTGDLNGDDTPTGNRGDNCHHVVTTAAAAGPSTIIEGFLITGGNADATSNRVGGGMFIPGGAPTISLCTFYSNQANDTSGAGGAIASLSAQSITITGCAFIENSAKFQFNSNDGSGGAIYAERAVITDCTFSGNRGNRGGAIFTSVACTMTGCTFDTNTASQGGALYLSGVAGAVFNITGCTFTSNTAGNGGAVNIFNSLSSTHFTDCVFRGNSATNIGGAINNLGNGMTATRCIFAGNSAASAGGAMSTSSGTALVTNCTIAFNISSNVTGGITLAASNSTPSIRNTILWGNTDAFGEGESAQIARFFATGTMPVVNYCDVQGLTPALGGVGNFDADPLFVDAFNGDFSLQHGSPCIDAGDPTMIDPDGSPSDVGAIRVQNAKPIADAVVTQLTAVGQSALIRLDATGSSDPDGDIEDLAIEWRVDGLVVCSGTFETCGVIEVPVAFGAHSIELVVTDAGNASGEDSTTIIVSPAALALLDIGTSKVEFDRGRFRLQGAVALPSTVSCLELERLVAASVSFGGIPAVSAMAMEFERRGNGNGSGNADAWRFDGPSGPGLIDRFDVEWGGTQLRFREGSFPVSLTSDTITSSESVVEMSYNWRRTGAFTLTINSAVINVSSNGNVTANVPIEVRDNGKEVTLILPFPITPDTNFVFTGGTSGNFNADRYLKITTGTFRIEGQFDRAAFPAGSATLPRTIELNLLVGAQGYPGTATVGAADLNVRHDTWVGR